MTKQISSNYKQLNQKDLWFKSLSGMSIGFFATLVISAVLQITTLHLPREFFTWDSPYIMVQVQNYLRFLTPFAVGITIGVFIKLNIYQILACGIAALLCAHSTLIPTYVVDTKTISFDEAKIGLNFFAPKIGDVFAAFLTTVLLVYLFKIFVIKQFYFELVIYPLIAIFVGLFATITIAPLSAIIFVSIQYIIGISISQNYWWSIVLAPVIGSLVGLALPLPISSTALAVSLQLSAKAGLIALTGTTSVTIVMTLMTFMATKSIGKTFIIWFGTPMILMAKYVHNRKMLLMPFIISVIVSLISAIIFDPVIINLTLNTQSIYVGLGFTGLFLPQILFMFDNLWWIALIHIITLQIFIPIILAYYPLRKFFQYQWLKQSDFDF